MIHNTTCISCEEPIRLDLPQHFELVEPEKLATFAWTCKVCDKLEEAKGFTPQVWNIRRFMIAAIIGGLSVSDLLVKLEAEGLLPIPKKAPVAPQ